MSDHDELFRSAFSIDSQHIWQQRYLYIHNFIQLQDSFWISSFSPPSPTTVSSSSFLIILTVIDQDHLFCIHHLAQAGWLSHNIIYLYNITLRLYNFYLFFIHKSNQINLVDISFSNSICRLPDQASTLPPYHFWIKIKNLSC